MKFLKQLNADVPVDETIQATSNQRIIARQRKNVRMVENVLLIWLDNDIDMNNVDCQNTVHQLQCAVTSIDIFTDGQECFQFLETIHNQKACVIISGTLGPHIVPQIHTMSQIDSIFIFCDNKQFHQQWMKDWSKIKGVFTEIDSICEALKMAVSQCEQNATPITFMATTDDISKKKLDQLDPSFMYSQILKEILLTIDFNQQHITELIQYCRDVYQNNEKELRNIKMLERQYRDKTPIWWYTRESFLYPMLNRALRVLDGDIIIRLGFFISDLHHQIEQLYQEQFSDWPANQMLTLYRGQGMNQDDFNKMKETEGGLLSFNCFLSTSRNQTISLRFAKCALTNPDLVGVLFVMTIDPLQSTTPFASVADVGHFKDKEGEILFSMHTVFQIGEITPMKGNSRLYQVPLTLTNDNDKDLSVLTDRIREETEGLTGWDQLGGLLLKIGQPAKAQRVYEILLEQSTDEDEKARFYHQLGWAKHVLGEYPEAVILYEKALEIRKQSLPSNHLHLAKSYNNIGLVYTDMGEYEKALSYYEKDLEITKQSRPSNHPDVAASYNNIGLVYCNMGEYEKALSSHEQALEIDKTTLPSNHPDLASDYNNIGSVYSNMGDYEKALSSHEQALEIQKQSLPSNHPDLAKSYNNIGLLYADMGEYEKALSSHEKALSSHEKALEIQKQSFSSNHPDLAASYNNIGLVYSNMGKYEKALSSYRKAFEIDKKSLSSNHPDLASDYNNIGLVYSGMGDYEKALSSHKKAFEIRKQALPSNHPDLAMSYNNIGTVYEEMENYSKARFYYKRAIEIGKQSLTENHPDLELYKNNLDDVKDKF